MKRIENLKEVLDSEVKSIKRQIENNSFDANTIAYNALQRCLGACAFAEKIGIPYSIIENLYIVTKEEIEGLLK